jgi:plastocyanin
LNGEPVAGGTSPTLAIWNVQAAHAGDYFVRVSNDAGSVDSAPATLSVLFSLTADSSTGGTVAKSPANENFSPGATVTLTATALENHEFVGWSGSASGNENPLTVTMVSNKTVWANFTPTYALSVTQSG